MTAVMMHGGAGRCVPSSHVIIVVVVHKPGGEKNGLHMWPRPPPASPRRPGEGRFSRADSRPR